MDKDKSAYSRKPRQQFERMMTDLETGQIDGVLAAHVNRLLRHTTELVRFVDVVQRQKAQVRTVMAGHWDLTTAAGRKHAYQAGLDAQYEAELLGERVARERAERAALGKPAAGGLRPFGYEPDKVTIRRSEAKLIRAAATEVAAGGSLWAVAERWNAAGVTTTAGNLWEVSSVRRVLTSPRIAGLRSFKGQVIGDAQWPAIITQDVHRRLVAMASGRAGRRPSRNSWLLSGLIACPRCGRPLYGATGSWGRAYKCSPRPTSQSCGGASITAGPADARVTATVQGWLDDPPRGLSRWLRTDTRLAVAEEADAIQAQRGALARMFAENKLSETDLEQSLAVLTARLAELDDEPGPPVPAGDVGRLADLWRLAEPAERRPVIEALIRCPIGLVPERRDDPADRLVIVPAWD